MKTEEEIIKEEEANERRRSSSILRPIKDKIPSVFIK